MNAERTIGALAALAHERRLAVFRLLMRKTPDEVSAGDIARALEVPHNTLSSQLTILLQAELIKSRRDGRYIYYSIDLDGVRNFLAFLLRDCCQGHPSDCDPLLKAILDGAEQRDVAHRNEIHPKQ